MPFFLRWKGLKKQEAKAKRDAKKLELSKKEFKISQPEVVEI